MKPLYSIDQAYWPLLCERDEYNFWQYMGRFLEQPITGLPGVLELGLLHLTYSLFPLKKVRQ